MLIIASQDKYEDFCRSGIKKPSEYCKSVLKIKRVKSQTYIKEYFADPNFLVKAIKKYKSLHKQKSGEMALFDLLKDKD